MPITQSYEFDNGANFTQSNTALSGGKARLALIPNPGQVFSEDFADDTGFTYDGAKAEFVGGLVRQVDLRPTDSVIAATYTSAKDLNWSASGSLVATEIGTPVLNAGKLECIGGGNNAARYENADIGASGNIGAIRVKYTPNYSGTPAANYNIFEFSPVSGNADRMLVLHSASGSTLRLTAYTSSGTVKHAAVPFGTAWSPVAGTEYELELNWDTIAGQVRLFVDGALQGSMAVSSYARGTSATRLYIGAGTVYSATDASFDDVLLFSTVQHTSAYTAGYTIPEFIYAENKVDGPNFTYSGVGTVLSVDAGSTTEAGAPRYIVGGQYWNGSQWVASNGSYAQANDFATALANFGTFDTGGGGVLPWSIVFGNSNTQSSVDEFSVEVTGEKYSLTGYLEPVLPIEVFSIAGYEHTILEGANSTVRAVLKIDGALKYWNGSAWVASNGTTAQANTAAEINTNGPSLSLSSNSTVFIRWILGTSLITETPELDFSSISYNFGAVETALTTCLVHGYFKDVTDTPVAGATITFQLNQKPSEYGEANKNVMSTKGVTTTTDSNGYFSLPLVRSSEFETQSVYRISITSGGTTISRKANGDLLTFEVPDATVKDISDLLPGA